MSENVAAHAAAAAAAAVRAQYISSEFGSYAFWRLNRGSKKITLTYPNGRETTGVQVRRNGKVWTVDVGTTNQKSDSGPMKWAKQQQGEIGVVIFVNR
jgi:hypothetical protein